MSRATHTPDATHTRRLTVPSGAVRYVSAAYRYAVVVDAGDGTWLELRTNSLAAAESRVRGWRGSRSRIHLFDTLTGEVV
jgi:hypothetical protein